MAGLKKEYTTQELATLKGVAVKNLLQLAKREGWKSLVRQGCGGGHAWLVASMPEATRAAITLACAKHVEEMPAPLMQVSDVVIPDWSWETGKARYRIVAEWQKCLTEAKKRGETKQNATAAFLTAVPLLLPETVLKAAGSISRPTLYRWAKALKTSNNTIEALTDRRGGWCSNRKKGLGQIGETAEQAFLSVYLRQNKPSVHMAYAAMELALQRQELPIPSYASVRRFLQRFDGAHHDLVVWMREGEKAYADKVGAFLSRKDSILEVGDVLVADGHTLNFLVKNPETGKPCRMTLIGWQDWASRVFVGFDIMLAENTQAISASLYRSILNLGKLPRAVYLDNGKAFKNKFFTGAADLEEQDGLYARLGIYVQHSQPYVARTKIIERWWGDFDRQCEVMLPSYTGASIEGKPAHMMRNELWQKKQHAKQAEIPTITDVVRIIQEYSKWKALQPHPTQASATPWNIFTAGQGNGFSACDAESLTRHFLHRKEVNPSRCRVTMLGVTFESEALHGINKPLMAHYAYTDLSQIYLYDEGKLLCTARPVESVHPLAILGDTLDVAAVKAGQKRVAGLRSTTRKLADALAERGDSSEALTALPWMRPANERTQVLILPDHRALPAQASAMSETERNELLAIAAAARRTTKPAYERPTYYTNEAERYEHLFHIVYEQQTPLTAEDAVFMQAFEASPRYALVAKRYAGLQGYYAAQQRGTAS